MRLTFDRGTLLLAQERDDVNLVDMPWVLWDARVGSYRAPPFRHAQLLAELRTRGIRVSDEATRFVQLPAGAFTTPALRDYQQSALDLWNAADRKGIVSLPTGSGKTVVATGAIAAGWDLSHLPRAHASPAPPVAREAGRALPRSHRRPRRRRA